MPLRAFMLRGVATPSLLLTALGCTSPTGPTVLGAWGGREASLVLTRSGGTVAYQCGAGTIDSSWTLSGDGHFVASGQHYFGGGPVPPEGHPPHPARYEGQVLGPYLTFTVTVTDLSETLGPFHLVRGGSPVVELCL